MQNSREFFLSFRVVFDKVKYEENDGKKGHAALTLSFTQYEFL